MKKFVRVGIVVLLVLIIISISAACAKSTPTIPPASKPGTVVPSPSVGSPPESLGGIFSRDQATSKEGYGNVQTPTDQRMIVRNGQISLVVNDVTKTRDDIAALAAGLNGYVVSSQIWGEGPDMRGTISIRVPDESFDSTLSEFRKMAVRVPTENTNSQDVTEEYVDLQSRRKNAEATESQYLALLEKSTNVEDTLKIYERLTQIRNEIEQIKGRMQYLERTTSMSLITVSLAPAASAKPLASAGWSSLETLKSALRGLVTLGQVLGTAILWLLVFSPLWGIILVIIIWIRRKRVKSTP